jgi:hypothetical protein
MSNPKSDKPVALLAICDGNILWDAVQNVYDRFHADPLMDAGAEAWGMITRNTSPVCRQGLMEHIYTEWRKLCKERLSGGAYKMTWLFPYHEDCVVRMWIAYRKNKKKQAAYRKLHGQPRRRLRTTRLLMG